MTDIDEYVEDPFSGMVSVPYDVYEELLADSEFLKALMAAGVDNWEGYEYAQELMDD